MLVITELGAGACVHPSPSFYCQRAAVELSISDALLAKHGSHRRRPNAGTLRNKPNDP